jgi:hypothetical protein
MAPNIMMVEEMLWVKEKVVEKVVADLKTMVEVLATVDIVFVPNVERKFLMKEV